MDRRDFLRTGLYGIGMLAGLETVSCVSTRQHFDTIIKHGSIFDGTATNEIAAKLVNTPRIASGGFVGDIGIRDGKIAAIGRNLGRSADRIIDADGLAVSPGFIDIHCHSDKKHLKAPKADSRIYQGITCELGGNCGDISWPKEARYDIGKFRKMLSDNGLGINYGSLVGHGDIREMVVGPYNVKASDEELSRMCDILDRELSNGALGLSFGLEYAPGCYCDTREMAALCRIVAEHNALYAIHMRHESDKVVEALTEAIEAARLSGARLQVSHLKAQNPANFDKLPQLLKMIDDARAEGIDIAFDRYPYTAFATGFTSFIPIELRDGTHEDILRRLENPKTASKIAEYTTQRLERFGGADKVLVAACRKEENLIYSGKNLEECCAISGMSPEEMVRYLLISEDLKVQQATFAMKEENLEMIYRHPLSMPGSDGSVYSPEGPLGKELPHPRSYGTFPRFFQKFVREKQVLDLTTAVHKCTGLPASRMNPGRRGLLKEGYAADITIFDPATIEETATYAQPHQFPKGIAHVLVNGAHVIEDGRHTEVLAGQLV